MVTDLTTPSTPVGFQESLLCLRFLSLFNSYFVWTKWLVSERIGFCQSGIVGFPLPISCCISTRLSGSDIFSRDDFMPWYIWTRSRQSTRIIDSWMALWFIAPCVRIQTSQIQTPILYCNSNINFSVAWWNLMIKYMIIKTFEAIATGVPLEFVNQFRRLFLVCLWASIGLSLWPDHHHIWPASFCDWGDWSYKRAWLRTTIC